VASSVLILASQLSGIIGGEDGLNYRLPMALRPSFRLFEGFTGRLLDYFLVFFVSLALVLAQNYLQALVGDRWLLWLGVAFILCVYFFPTGIVGRRRRRR
jgi:ABC-type branched-subunit amino acid transport system permease subunit